MGVALAIVLDRLPLHRFFGQLPGELDRRLAAGKHADLQGGQGLPGVAVAHLGEEVQGVVVQTNLAAAQAPLACRPPPGGATS